MGVVIFVFCLGNRTEDGKKRSFFHAEESSRKPEGFRGSEASEISPTGYKHQTLLMWSFLFVFC